MHKSRDFRIVAVDPRHVRYCANVEKLLIACVLIEEKCVMECSNDTQTLVKLLGNLTRMYLIDHLRTGRPFLIFNFIQICYDNCGRFYSFRYPQRRIRISAADGYCLVSKTNWDTFVLLFLRILDTDPFRRISLCPFNVFTGRGLFRSLQTPLRTTLVYLRIFNQSYNYALVPKRTRIMTKGFCVLFLYRTR